MPVKLICHTPDCINCGEDCTCKLGGEIRVDQKRCQSYAPHSIPFMEKPLALSELPKKEWVCHILEESGATFVTLEDFYEPYGKALRRDLIWRIPYGCQDFSGCVLCLVQEGILCLPYRQLYCQTLWCQDGHSHLAGETAVSRPRDTPPRYGRVYPHQPFCPRDLRGLYRSGGTIWSG